MYSRFTIVIILKDVECILELLRRLCKITFCVTDFSQVAKCFTVSVRRSSGSIRFMLFEKVECFG